jgi:DnaK suppressor protein
MDTEKLERYRRMLNSRLESLVGTVQRSREQQSEGAEIEPDLTDQASQDWDRNFDMRIRDRERRLIAKIREALSRIEDGTFGICEMCGEEISEKRLDARPVTTLCIDCKTESERWEKQRFEDEE